MRATGPTHLIMLTVTPILLYLNCRERQTCSRTDVTGNSAGCSDVTGKSAGCSDVRQYSKICLERLKKTTNIPIQDVAELSITTQWYCPLSVQDRSKITRV
jgi:hypothetical protein